MHLRRALLLFAIVLGLAAIAASVSRQPQESGERAERPPAAAPEETPTLSAPPDRSTVELTFNAARERSRSVNSGQAATVFVEVDEPGLVEIPDLGFSSPADPLTPARFDVLVSEPDRYRLVFTPAAGDAAEPAGVLVVEDGEE